MSKFDWPTLIANKDKQIARLNGYYRRAVERAGGVIIDDRAVLKDAHTIHLVRSNRDVTAEKILIATGGYPSRDDRGRGHRPLHHLGRSVSSQGLPKSIVIVGGGYIALEFAHIFHGLGVRGVADLSRREGAPRLRRGLARRAPATRCARRASA